MGFSLRDSDFCGAVKIMIPFCVPTVIRPQLYFLGYLKTGLDLTNFHMMRPYLGVDRVATGIYCSVEGLCSKMAPQVSQGQPL